MSDIPEARRQLLLVAKMADADTAARIRHIISKYMTREKPVRRAPVKSRGVTSGIALQIRKYAAANPTAHFSEIATRFGVNQGRVSEVLTRKIKVAEK